MQNFHFAELNIKHRGNPRNTLDLVRRAIRMGYDSIVINIDIGFFGEKIEEACLLFIYLRNLIIYLLKFTNL
jgi:hypothetical protein